MLVSRLTQLLRQRSVSRTTRRRRLTAEQLEERRVLAVASLSGTGLFFSANPGESNNVAVFEDASAIRLRDTGAPISVGAGPFTVISPNEVSIPLASLTLLNLNLGDMNDSLDASAVTAGSGLVQMIISGGAGSDTLIGSQLDDSFSIFDTQPGADSIDGQGQISRDSIRITSDTDVWATDTTLTVGSLTSTYADLELIDVSGGASDNLIDVSGITTAGDFNFVQLNGGNGDDTIIGSQLADTLTIIGATPGADIIDLQGQPSGQLDSVNFRVTDDLIITDTTLSIGIAQGSHTNLERVSVDGSAGDDLIDLSGITSSGDVVSTQINGLGGDDTILGSQLADIFVVSGVDPGADSIDGQGQLPGSRDVLFVNVDVDVTLSDTVLQLGSNLGAHQNLENISIDTGASPNIIDFSAITASSGILRLQARGGDGDDEIIPGALSIDHALFGGAGFDRLNLSLQATLPTINVQGPGSIDGQAGFINTNSSFTDIDQIDLPSVYDFTAANYSVQEGNSTATTMVVEVTRTNSLSKASSVDIVLTDDTATAGSDYTAGRINIAFAPGEATKSVPVEILGDNNFEIDEVLGLSIANGIAGSNQPTASLTIVNDDIANQPVQITAVSIDATFQNKAMPGDVVTLMASFVDLDANDTHTASIDWGDGTTSPGVVNSPMGTITASHSYTTGGIFEVTITVQDSSLAADSSTTDAIVTGLRLTSAGVLEVVGSRGRDKVQFTSVPGNAGPLLQATLRSHIGPGAPHFDSQSLLANSVLQFAVYTYEGNDRILIQHNIDIPSFIDAGEGNDLVLGGAGNDMVFGGPGHDLLFGFGGNDVLTGDSGFDLIKGGRGDDLLIGGTGKDLIFGGRGEDLLIGGFTEHDGDADVLSAVASEWTNASDMASRVSSLSSGLLSSDKVHDDNTRDWLMGGGGSDWYFADLAGRERDRLLGYNPQEDHLTELS